MKNVKPSLNDSSPTDRTGFKPQYQRKHTSGGATSEDVASRTIRRYKQLLRMVQAPALTQMNAVKLLTTAKAFQVGSKSFLDALRRYSDYRSRRKDAEPDQSITLRVSPEIATTLDNLDMYIAHYQKTRGQNRWRRPKHLAKRKEDQVIQFRRLVRERRVYLSGLVHVLTRCMFDRQFFKTLGSESRSIAMKATLPKVIASHFYASTIARAMMPECSERAKRRAMIKTTKEWKKSRSFNRRVMDEVAAQVSLTLKRYRVQQHIPDAPETMPATKACIERPVREGGAMRHMLEFGKESAEQMGIPISMLPEMFGEPSLSSCLRTLAVNLGCFGMREMVPVSITQLGGKIRVITKHPAAQVTCARHLMNTWVKILKNVGPCRILNGKGVMLKKMGSSHKEVRFFSADLTKATDLIAHDLAKRVAGRLMDELWPGHWMNAAVLDLFGPKDIQSDIKWLNGQTESGIHMGLGPTWVVLSLINIGCARLAGARWRSFAVCGDDLIGWWPEDVRDRYVKNLTDCGLEVNMSKSYWSESTGVFCEGYVVRKTEVDAELRWDIKMSEWFSSQWRFFRSGTMLNAALGAPRGAPIRRCLAKLPRGPAELGMGGVRRPTRKEMMQAWSRGARPVTYTRSTDELTKALKKATMKVIQRQSSHVRVADALPWITRLSKERRIPEAIAPEKIDGKKFLKMINGEAYYIKWARFNTLHKQRVRACNIPKTIRNAINRRPWSAIKLIQKAFSKKMIDLSMLQDVDISSATVVRNSGAVDDLISLLKPRQGQKRNSDFGSQHPLFERFSNPLG
jgi:hypothetical protein